jgi:hypothetical protein
MRILFTAKHPPGGRAPYGGVLSWIETMAAQLRRLGHDCAVWGPELKQPEGRFDLGFIANATSTDRAAQWCDRVLGVSHGVVADERPNPSIRTVFTSEEGRDHWEQPTAPVLRQPIDLEFWSPGDKPRENLLTFYSYRSPDDMGLDRAARHMGMAFHRLRNVSAETARDVLRRSKIVAASGRAAVEAMACGAAVIICDHRVQYQAPLFDRLTTLSMKQNYSGRGGESPTQERLLETIRSRVTHKGQWREWAEKNHDVRKIAAELLAL